MYSFIDPELSGGTQTFSNLKNIGQYNGDGNIFMSFIDFRGALACDWLHSCHFIAPLPAQAVHMPCEQHGRGGFVEMDRGCRSKAGGTGGGGPPPRSPIFRVRLPIAGSAIHKDEARLALFAIILIINGSLTDNRESILS